MSLNTWSRTLGAVCVGLCVCAWACACVCVCMCLSVCVCVCMCLSVFVSVNEFACVVCESVFVCV